MKYSVSSRQSSEILEKCDVINVSYNDKNIILDLVERYPNKIITLLRRYEHNAENINWEEIKNYNILLKEKFLFGVSSLEELYTGISLGIQCFFLLPARTFRELRNLKEIGVCQIIVDTPLFFQMEAVKNIGIPIRVIANSANQDIYLSCDDGVVGPWIRPEDIDLYENYIDTIEFSYKKLEQEKTLFKIYSEDKKWPGKLDMIIQDLRHSAVNRLIPPDFAERRLNCGHKCQINQSCHHCWHILDIASQMEKLRELKP